MSSAGGIILAIAAIAVVGGLVWKRCEIDFMKFMCEKKGGSAQMQAISNQIKKQSDFSNPDTAKAVKQYIGATNNSDWCKTYGINCPKSNLATSLFATTRLSI